MSPLLLSLALIVAGSFSAYAAGKSGSIFIGLVVGFGAAFVTSQLERFLTARRTRLADDEAYRKLDAKKHNEHLKLIASFCNTVGAAVLGAAFIVPYIGQHAGPEQVDLRWVGAGLALPFAGHIALRFMKSEG